MAVEENKALVRRFYDAIQLEEWERVGHLCHDDFVFYTQVDTPIVGRHGFVEIEKKNFESIPGFRLQVLDVIAEGNRVAAYLIIEGVQTRPLMGLPPTGNKLRFSALNLLTIAHGKIVETRAHFDVHDILRQLTTER